MRLCQNRHSLILKSKEMSEVKILTKKNLIDILKLVLPKGSTSSSEKKYPFLFIKDDPDFRDGTILYSPSEHYFVQAPDYDTPVANEYNEVDEDGTIHANTKLRFYCMGKTYRYTGHDFINVALEALPAPTRVSTRPVTINSTPGIAYPVSRTGLNEDPYGATILLPYNHQKEVQQYDLKNMYWADDNGGIYSLISYCDELGTVDGDTLTLGSINTQCHLEHAIKVDSRCNFISVRYDGEKKIFYGVSGYERKKFDAALIWKRLQYSDRLNVLDANKRIPTNSSNTGGEDYVSYYGGWGFDIQVQEWGLVRRRVYGGDPKYFTTWRHLTGNSISTRNGKKRALIRMRIVRDVKHTRYAPSDWVYMHVDFRREYMPVPSRQKRVHLSLFT